MATCNLSNNYAKLITFELNNLSFFQQFHLKLNEKRSYFALIFTFFLNDRHNIISFYSNEESNPHTLMNAIVALLIID